MSITDTLGRRPALPPRLVMLASFAGTSVVNYGFGLASGWLLLPADFGLLAFAQTVLLIAGLALNSGFAWSLTKESVGVDEARRGALVRGAAVANLLLALAIAGAITLLYVFGPFRNGLETTMILVLVILALPPLAFIAIARAAAQGAERFGLVALLQIGEVGSKAIAGTGLILAGLGPAGAVAGFVVGGLVAGLAGIWVVAGKLQVRLRGPLALGAVRKAAPIFGALLGTALLLNLDILLLKILVSGNRAVAGHYQAAIVLANTPYFLTTAMIPVLFTQATRARALEHTAATVGEALRWVLLLAIPIEIGVLIAPEAALALLFPDEYRPGQLVIRS
ncbi:MAG TPA: oligosaccharide flippase family protein, partial [Herpetosiphonaceae bacterium]|nr:oligosaccharide flippase family protein [Herpetosiphonaceae bacterium]